MTRGSIWVNSGHSAGSAWSGRQDDRGRPLAQRLRGAARRATWLPFVLAALAVVSTTAAAGEPPQASAHTPAAPDQSFEVEAVEIEFVRSFGLTPFERPADAMLVWRKIVDENAALETNDPGRIDLSARRIPVRRVGSAIVGATEGESGSELVPLDQLATGPQTRLHVSAIELALQSLDGAVPTDASETLAASATDSSTSPDLRMQGARARARIQAQLSGVAADPLRRGTFTADGRPVSLRQLEDVGLAADVRRLPDGRIALVDAGSGGKAYDLVSLFGEGPATVEPSAAASIAESVRVAFCEENIDVLAAPLTPRGSGRVLRIGVAFVGPLGAPPLEVARFVVDYGGDSFMATDAAARKELPDPAGVLAGATAALIRRPDGVLTDWYPGGEPVSLPLDATFAPSERFSVAGLQAVLDGITAAFVRKDLMGVLTRPAPTELNLAAAGADARTGRSGDPAEFRVQVRVGVLDAVRTVATGQGDLGPFGDVFHGVLGGSRQVEQRIDAKEHRRLKEKLPIEPGQIVDRRKLENYLDLLSRHPGRRVDAAVTPVRPPEGQEPSADRGSKSGGSDAKASDPASGGADGAPRAAGSGEPLDLPVPGTAGVAPAAAEVPQGNIGLDLLVSENNPLLIYVQGSNTGTSETGQWRQRFGLIHSQLTGNDDILSLEYVTASFERTQAFIGSYDAKVGDLDRLRWKVQGLWGEYSAADVGFAEEQFEGESWSVAGELAWNFYQDRKLFVDAVAGIRFFNSFVNNETVDLTGDADFLVPSLGVRCERITREARSLGLVMFDFNIPAVTDQDSLELSTLGRLLPTEEWYVMRWDLQQTLYLDPFFTKDPKERTLAHEVALLFRGQYAFDNRLIPQEEGVLGGLATVRGYPQSVVAGDTTLVGTAEYRLHLPQALGFQQDPADLFGRPFRFRPQFAYGTTDWDVILRAFVDVGQTYISDPFSFESDYTLVGTGVGVEFQLWRNLNIRIDWGFALEELPGLVNSGSNRLYFLGTLSF